MASKRAKVPPEVYGQRPSALDKLTGATALPNVPAVPHDSNEAARQQGNTVLPQAGATVHAKSSTRDGNEKVTFYLRPDQVDKLDELALVYKRWTGSRINRNELVRRLIDRADLDLLLAPHSGPDKGQ
jgi:hypothetical protein